MSELENHPAYVVYLLKVCRRVSELENHPAYVGLFVIGLSASVRACLRESSGLCYRAAQSDGTRTTATESADCLC